MLLLCVTVLTLSMGQPAKAVVTEAALASALLATLAAFGISLSAAGGIDSVGPWVVDKFENFVDSIGESIANVVDSMRYGVDKSGNLIGSPASLDYSARFALALQNEYSLVDNSVTSSSSVYSVFVGNSECLVISSPNDTFFVDYIKYNNLATSYLENLTLMVDITSYPVYLTCYLLPDGYLHPALYSPSSFRSVIFRPADNLNKYYLMSTGSSDRNVAVWGADRYLAVSGITPLSFSSVPSDVDLFGDYTISSPDNESIVISTGSIDIPQLGDYDDDDGILIDGFGSWGDTLQDIWNKVDGLTFPDSVWPTVEWGAELADQLVDSLVSAGELTTENSPGFFNGLPLISGIPDFSFGDLWHYVTDWVGYMSGGLSLIGGIMFSLPFVAAFYALVVILIVLSLWRLLRSA